MLGLCQWHWTFRYWQRPLERHWQRFRQSPAAPAHTATPRISSPKFRFSKPNEATLHVYDSSRPPSRPLHRTAAARLLPHQSTQFAGNPSARISAPAAEMANPLSGLQDHLKLARDYALEGLYDTSIIFFDGTIAQINKWASYNPLTRRPSCLITPWIRSLSGYYGELAIGRCESRRPARADLRVWPHGNGFHFGCCFQLIGSHSFFSGAFCWNAGYVVRSIPIFSLHVFEREKRQV